MKSFFQSSVLSLCALSGLALAGTWSGHVMHGLTRQPMAGVEVKGPFNQRVLTDINGRYAFAADAMDLPMIPSMESDPSVSWDPVQQTLKVSANQPHSLRMDLVDPAGRTIESLFEGWRPAGASVHRIGARSRHLGPLFLRLSVDGKSRMVSSLDGMAVPKSRTPRLARTASASGWDTLQFVRVGLRPRSLVVASTATSVDTVWLVEEAVGLENIWNTSVVYDSIVDFRDGQAYRIVSVNGERWLAENLRFRPLPPSTDTGECNGGDLSSCRIFGRNYRWGTVMAGEYINPWLSRPANGICPVGWHVPSMAEWWKLGSDLRAMGKSGSSLHSMAGWASPWRNGSDDFGFRAMPNYWNWAVWWSSVTMDGDIRQPLSMVTPFESAYTFGTLQNQRPVRCKEGNIPPPHDTLLGEWFVNAERRGGPDGSRHYKILMMPEWSGLNQVVKFYPLVRSYQLSLLWHEDTLSLSGRAADRQNATVTIDGIPQGPESIRRPAPAPGSSASISAVVRGSDGDQLVYTANVTRDAKPADYGIPWNAWGDYEGHLVDKRDGKKYQIVRVENGGRWLAQNLDFKAPGADSGICAMNDCAKYGRQYLWNTARAWQAPSEAIPSGVRGICPAGSHLPSDGEWQLLAWDYPQPVVNTRFMSLAGWSVGGGSDEWGFRAIPTNSTRNLAAWWTSTVHALDTIKARGLRDNYAILTSTKALKSVSRLSVRCAVD